MAGPIDVVFLDVGGPLYSDRPYYEALLAAILEARPDADGDAFWSEYDSARRDQRGPFTPRLVGRFVPEEVYEGVVRRARELWTYEPEHLQPDAHQGLKALGGYRLGILANQQRWIRGTMARDGLDGYFELWTISDEVGIDKPDPGIFEHALDQAGVPAERCAFVADRLDNDIIPSLRAGMRPVWMLRGEAPPDPNADQLALAEASVRSLLELPGALERLAT